MMEHETLYDALTSLRQSERGIGYILGENNERRLTYAELNARALGILAHVQELGAKKGDRMIVFLNNNEQFIDAFWACICGGVVPVPIAVGISDEHKYKLFRIAKQLSNAYLYTESKSHNRLEIFADDHNLTEEFSDLAKRTLLVDTLEDMSRHGEPNPPAADDVCLIQYSSGSTSEPKGVVLTHENLLANVEGIAIGARLTGDDLSLNWMPLTHDMGLIGIHVTHLVTDMDQYVIQTDLFIRRPVLWLQEASRKKASVLCSPNFGYKHFLKVFKPEKAGPLDLSPVRIIFNGAEPISASLCRDFNTTLAPHGLKSSAILPVYGLAEASVCVTMPEPETDYRGIRVDRSALGIGDTVREVESDSSDTVNLICVGKAIRHCETRIADDSDSEVGDAIVGHIHIRGTNVTSGYFEQPQANDTAFRSDGWLDTGDLGFSRGGDIYITGRAKEVVFVNGQNYYPHDLEAIAQETVGLELGKVAIAGFRPKGAQTDELLVFVLHRGSLENFVAKANLISRIINEHAGVEVTHVVPVSRIPKTTSGKIQRGKLAAAFADGEFGDVVAELEGLRDKGHGNDDYKLSKLESRIKEICDTVLSEKAFGVDDNLFEIGTSSLELIQIHEQIEEEFPDRLDITEMADFPTVSAIASRLESLAADA